MYRFLIPIFLITILSSCGRDANSVEQKSTTRVATINLESDEDRDGLSNYQEIKFNLSRKEFNRPSISFSKIKIEFRDLDKIKYVNESSIRPNYVHLDQNDIFYSFEKISNFSISDRFEFEELIANGPTSIRLEAQIHVNHPHLYELKRINVDLAIFHKPSGKFKVLNQNTNLNIDDGSFFDIEFEFGPEEFEKFKSFPSHWDFALIVEDLEWATSLKKFSWKNVSPQLIHLLVETKYSHEQIAFFPQFVNDFSLLKEKELRKLKNGQLMENHEELKAHDVVTVLFKENYEMIKNHNNYEIKDLQIENDGWKDLMKNRHVWQRIDLSFMRRNLSKALVAGKVQVMFEANGPCPGGYGRKNLRLCEGERTQFTCDVVQEIPQINESLETINLDQIEIDTPTGPMTLRQWITLSGAEILDNQKLVRWEGLRDQLDIYTPLRIRLKQDSQIMNYGFQDPQCPHVINGRQTQFDRKRNDIKVSNYINLEVYNY